MIPNNSLIVLTLAIGAIAGLVTVGVVGDAEFDDVESGIEHNGLHALDISGFDVEGSSIDIHVMTGVGPKTATVPIVRTTAAGPTARLKVSPNPALPEETVTLDGTDSMTDQGDIVECDFDSDGDGAFDMFGDLDCVMTYQYNQTGQYELAVRVRDTQQRTDVDTRTLIVAENQPPDADFTWLPTGPSPGESIEFNASDSADSDGELVEYRWDFDDDGSIETIRQTPTATHAFDQAGTYPVTLEVVDDDGASASSTREVTVRGDPVARCSVSDTDVGAGEQVVIDASDSNAELVRFDLDGNGTFDRTNNDDFQEVVTYADSGTYAPVVRAQFNQQTDTQQCPVITVAENEPPRAAFTVEPKEGTVGKSMTFDASDSEDVDGEIVEYRWDWDNDDNFEDTTTVDTATHTFDKPGPKTVHLRVVDDDGATDLASIQGIVVREATTPTATATLTPDPDASCTVSKTEALPDETVVIRASGELQQIEFDVDGDGTYDESEEGAHAITHRYDEPGTYEPSARMSDERQRTRIIPCGTITVIKSSASRTTIPRTTPGGEGSGFGVGVALVALFGLMLIILRE